jgi:hypothetical protein
MRIDDINAMADADIRENEQKLLEEVRKVERTELFNSIFSIVKKIPRKDVDGDAMDAPSCAYDIEQLFYKWQQERMYSEEEDTYINGYKKAKETLYTEEDMLNFAKFVYEDDGSTINNDGTVKKETIEQFKQK